MRAAVGGFFHETNTSSLYFDKEFLRNFIISDEEYHQVNIEGIQPPDLLVVEITGIEDLCRAKRIRGIFPRGRLLVVSTNQISAESYLIPEVSPDDTLHRL